MRELEQLVDSMEPAEALAVMGPALKKILSHLDEDSRIRFVTGMLEETDNDKISSMVNL
jgi:hypothetical protein